MDTYFAGSPVTVAFQLQDDTIPDLTAPEAVSVTVLNENGDEIHTENMDPLPSEGELEMFVRVTAEANTLAAGAVRGFRMIQAEVTKDGATYLLTSEYVIESTNALETGTNSFQTYGQAIVNAASMANVEAFNEADRRNKVVALSTAYQQISRLTFSITKPTANGGYERLRLTGLLNLKAEDYLDLPKQFVDSLRLAQVAEANELLDTNSIAYKRQQGLLSESIGESTMFFRPEKALLMPVNRRTMDLLRGYVVWEVNLGRS